MRLVAALLLLTALTACESGAPRPRMTSATTAQLPDGYLHVVFNDEGIVVEPAPDGVGAKWTRSEALAAVTKNAFFREGRRRVWFGSYKGQAAWLAIADGVTVAPSLGHQGRGYIVAVFADGETPGRTLSGVATTGGDPVVDVAPKRPKYNGRLHVTFVTPGGGEIGGSLAKWMMEPAPWAHARQSVDEAQRRSQSATANVGMAGAHVYFGLFTGLDDAGTMHYRTKAWMVFATGYATRVDGGPCCNHTPITFKRPMPTFGASAFSDDLTVPWVSGRLTSNGHPLVF